MFWNTYANIAKEILILYQSIKTKTTLYFK